MEEHSIRTTGERNYALVRRCGNRRTALLKNNCVGSHEAALPLIDVENCCNSTVLEQV